MDRHRLLILGSSVLTYDGDGPSYTRLIDRALSDLDPARAWTCEARTLFHGAAMGRRALALAENENATVVILHLDANQITNDSVSFSIRRRWPRFFPLAIAIARYVDSKSGGDGERSPKRWLFTAPRWLAGRVLGMAPELGVDEAIGFVREAISNLVRNEGFDFFCSLPGAWSQKDEQRVARYRSLLLEICQTYRVRTFEDSFGIHWTRAVAAPDGIHASLPMRQARSRLFANFLVEALRV